MPMFNDALRPLRVAPIAEWDWSIVAIPVPRRPGGAESCHHALQVMEACFCRTRLLGSGSLRAFEGGLAR